MGSDLQRDIEALVSVGPMLTSNWVIAADWRRAAESSGIK